MSEFWKKYRDPRWQRRRLEIMQTADFACQHCGDKSETLNVHHKAYTKGADPWDYADLELMCLCETCHEEWHKAKNNFQIALQWLSLDDYREVVGYAIGIALRSCGPGERIYFRHQSGIEGLSKATGIPTKAIERMRDECAAVYSSNLQTAMKRRKPKRAK